MFIQALDTNSTYKPDQLVSLLAQSQQSSSGHNGVLGSRHMSPFNQIQTNGHSTNFDSGSKKSPLLTHKLNGTEITAVRQLITGRSISFIED